MTYEVSGFPCTEQRFASQRFYYTHDPKSLVYILNVDEKPDVEVVEAEIFLSFFLIVGWKKGKSRFCRKLVSLERCSGKEIIR